MTQYHYGIITGWMLGVACCVWFDTFLRSRRRRQDEMEQRLKTIEDYLKPLQDYGKERS